MKFNIYGRFQLDVVRENAAWEVYRIELGKRVKLHDIVIPDDLDGADIAIYLDDLFHEYAGPGQSIDLLN